MKLRHDETQKATEAEWDAWAEREARRVNEMSEQLNAQQKPSPEPAEPQTWEAWGEREMARLERKLIRDLSQPDTAVITMMVRDHSETSGEYGKSTFISVTTTSCVVEDCSCDLTDGAEQELEQHWQAAFERMEREARERLEQQRDAEPKEERPAPTTWEEACQRMADAFNEKHGLVDRTHGSEAQPANDVLLSQTAT